MYKVLFSLLLLCAVPAIMYAQPKIEKSEPIEEPAVTDYDKILLLKNGNTCYLHYSGNDGIEISMYDLLHKLTFTNRISSEKWDGSEITNTTILGAYEINSEIVIFLQQPDSKRPVLYRLRINTDDGKLLKEDVVAVLKKGNSYFKRDIVQTQLHVIKDPKSGCYAIVFYDNIDEQAAEAVRIMHFDEKHSLLGTAKIMSPDEKIKHVVFLDAAVNGNKSVYVSIYYLGDNDNESKIFISKLNYGDSIITSKALDFSNDFHSSVAQLLYNHTNDKLQMLIVTHTKTKGNFSSYMSLLCTIDPTTLNVSGVMELPNNNINMYGRKMLDSKTTFSGVPQAMLLHNDGNFTIIKQEMTFNARGMIISSTNVGDIGISEFGAEGAERTSFLLPFRAQATGLGSILYLKNITSGKWDNFYRGNRHESFSMQDYSPRYITGKKNNYLITNDYCKGIDHSNINKLASAYYERKNTNTYYTTLKNGNATECTLFGPLEGKRDSYLCFMDAADQNDDGLFATLVTAKKGKSTETRVMWITFE